MIIIIISSYYIYHQRNLTSIRQQARYGWAYALQNHFDLNYRDYTHGDGAEYVRCINILITTCQEQEMPFELITITN